jgi:hypothetical protein
MMQWPLYIVGKDERPKFIQSIPRLPIIELEELGWEAAERN